MYNEDDLLPLSALQHLLFCERQCALIHVEGLWAENALTVEGGHLHRRVHESGDEARRDVRVARALALRSLRLGMSGIADAVEFRRVPAGTPGGAALPGAAGRWQPFPVEYKRGKPKRDRSDEVQLCAQALCLEEILGAPVPQGALFYGRTRRRLDVPFDAALRQTTEQAITRLRALMISGVTPRAAREPKCDRCSLLHLCLPDAMTRGRSAARYLTRALASVEHDTP